MILDAKFHAFPLEECPVGLRVVGGGPIQLKVSRRAVSAQATLMTDKRMGILQIKLNMTRSD